MATQSNPTSKQPASLRSLPYRVPESVKGLGEPEQIFLPGRQCSRFGKMMGRILAAVTLSPLVIGGTSLYCAVHPFGTNPPPTIVLWIVGGFFAALACGTAFGSYYYFSGAGDNKQAYLIYANCLVELFPKQHRIIPWEKIGPSKSSIPAFKIFRFTTGAAKDIAFDGSLPKHAELAALIGSRGGRRLNSGLSARAAGSGAGTRPPAMSGALANPADSGEAGTAQNTKMGMESLLLNQPQLQGTMGNLIDALVKAAPAHYAMIHLVADVRKANGKTSVLFTHGTPVLNEYSTLVPDAVANAAFALVDALQKQDDAFPGFEIVLRKTGVTNWNLEFHGLNERGVKLRNLPRYPIRLCGYGFSLAPVPGTAYRFMHNANPFGVVVSARLSESPVSKAPVKQLQIVLSEAEPKVVLGQGVTKAAEVVQVSDGPASKQWMIETPMFRTTWPDGLDLRYAFASKTRFELVGTGAENTIVFVQEPAESEHADERILDTMATDGQSEVSRGKTSAGHEWIELAYEFEGKQWRQRHYKRSLKPGKYLVVTAQCMLPFTGKVFLASDEVTDLLQAPIS